MHWFNLSWKGKWNQNIVIFFWIFLLPGASVSIAMMLFMLFLWHKITFWRWSAAVSFCHEIAFWGLSTSLSFRILLQRLLLQDLEHATFSARKPSQTSVPIYIWWSFYFYGGKEQLWAIDSKTLSQKTKLLFPLKIWVPTYLFCPQALGLKSRQGISQRV